MANCFWFYSSLAGWLTWQWVFLNFSQKFWSFDTPDSPGCASAMFAENEIWNRSKRFLPVCTGSSQGRHRAVIGLSKGSQRAMKEPSQGHHRLVIALSKGFHRQSQGGHWTVTLFGHVKGPSQDCPMVFKEKSQGCMSKGSQRAITQLSQGCHRTVKGPSQDCHMVVKGQSQGCQRDIKDPSQGCHRVVMA